MRNQINLDSYGDVIKQLRELVIKRGKKPYMLAVGKPSPAKLGNFLDIDVFCLVSCPENALVDSKEFLRPIVTPYELMLALDPNSGWQAEKYELDLAKMASSLEVEMKKDVDCSEGHFSLATGRMMRNVSLADTNDHDHHDTEGVIIERGPHHVSTNVVSSAAAVFLNERTFKGLEPRIGETDAKFAVQGRRGIARNYQA